MSDVNPMSVMTVPAQFPSRCGECQGAIRPGELITPGVTSFWRHVVCPPGKLDITREVCTGCFTEKSVDGSCLCGAI